MSECSEWVRCWVEHEKKNSISSSNHVLFCLLYNPIALYWEEKTTSLMNKNKWIDNPWIAIIECIGANS